MRQGLRAAHRIFFNTNPNILIGICGRFTPEQKVIARNKNLDEGESYKFQR